jgi:hypothetical protein
MKTYSRGPQAAVTFLLRCLSVAFGRVGVRDGAVVCVAAGAVANTAASTIPDAAASAIANTAAGAVANTTAGAVANTTAGLVVRGTTTGDRLGAGVGRIFLLGVCHGSPFCRI